MTHAAIRISFFLGIICLSSVQRANAATGWVCSETPQDQSAVDKDVNRADGLGRASIQKYEIDGNQLKWEPDNSTVINGIQTASPWDYQIVTNNRYGLVAIFTDVKKYPSGPQVWADVIEIDKTKDTIWHFSGSATDQNGAVDAGPCTSY